MKNIFTFLVLTFFVQIAFAQAPKTMPGCPQLIGTATRPLERTLNVLKNRYTAPMHINKAITLERVLAHGNDLQRWSDTEAVTITGYVVKVKPGGVESCNCDKPDLLDTHIELGLTPDAVAADCMVVEITPRWRVKHSQWATANLRKMVGKKITIIGWLMFDAEHANASTNTAKSGAHCWRGTAWEVHPITTIQGLP